ncbi:MAG: hypothetical protein JSS50_01765 [Proteobacteria bacterium]|nr:hypothetical protein [Pseudomonadota bacterium]
MNLTSSKVNSILMRDELDGTERRIVMRAGQKWLLKCEQDNTLLQLNALEAAIEVLKLYDKRIAYEPAVAFNQLYRKFNHLLLLDYSSLPYRHFPPSTAELNHPYLPNLKPAGHYFTKSAALWKYGLNKFGFIASVQDHEGNNTLMNAIKQQEFFGAIAVIHSTKFFTEPFISSAAKE